MESSKKIAHRQLIILGTLLSGTIIPLVDTLAYVQIFFLAVPLCLLLFGSLAYLFGKLIFRGQKDDQALFFAFIIPTLVASQIIGPKLVDKVQRFRSEQIIKEIGITGEGPSTQESFGIRIVNWGNSNGFEVSYAKGFMVREVYNSSTKSWRTLGWND